MSQSAIRQALEQFLLTLGWDASQTAFENADFVPPVDPSTPFQEAYLLMASPENPTMGDNFHRERGLFQISLKFPMNGGTGDIEARADALQAAFYRGLSLTANNVTTTVAATPAISQGEPDGNRYVKIVKVPVWANIFS
jgi:hypothetical protein